MIGFRLGDLWTDTFTYTKGKRAGEQGVSLKARLLFVSWIKVDGKLVYKAEPKPTETDERDPEVPVTSDAPAAQQATAPEPSRPVADAADEPDDEIGRPPCRARGGQYVWIPEGAGAVKK